MITSSVVRFARTASAQSSLQSASACIAATSSSCSSLSSHQLPFQCRKEHQRRNSSSKASIPPNGSSRGRSSTAPSAQTSSSSSGRSIKGRKPKAPMVESGFAHLPSVPSTQHLHPEDINVSSFFSLHRPISVTAAIPSTTSAASFAQIFDHNSFMLKHQPLEVIKTLGSVVEELEGGQRDRYIEEAGNMTQGEHHGQIRAGIPRDFPSSKLAEYRPFTIPPVPEAQNEMPASKATKRASQQKDSTHVRSWQTTINVTEQTTPTGQKIYTATSVGPLVENVIGEAGAESLTVIERPFLEKMRIRQQKWEAISVKRQRKLKMKKHKYKKLMKRTRNERRRMGKI